MKIIRCNEINIDDIYEIEKKSFADPLKKETMLSDLKREEHYCYALLEEKPIAFISYDKVFEEGQIISVAVDPDHRKKGLGAFLLKEVCKIAEKEGVEVFTLEVRSDNYPAIALYEKTGFVKVGVRKNYYNNPLCDGILMDLRLKGE